jgi:hypothetical protein
MVGVALHQVALGHTVIGHDKLLRALLHAGIGTLHGLRQRLDVERMLEIRLNHA